jgi:hypothetical protein
MEVDWTYTEEWFLSHSVDKNIEQEDWGGRGVWYRGKAEMLGKTWSHVKEIAGNQSQLALLFVE